MAIIGIDLGTTNSLAAVDMDGNILNGNICEKPIQKIKALIEKSVICCHN